MLYEYTVVSVLLNFSINKFTYAVNEHRDKWAMRSRKE
jgi:hypothetical protein